MAAIEEEPVTRQGRSEESTYVIQVEQVFELDGDPPTTPMEATAWADVATVTVPSRTKRKRVIREGLRKANMTVDPEKPLKVRALNEESAHVLTVGLETPEPQLKIA